MLSRVAAVIDDAIGHGMVGENMAGAGAVAGDGGGRLIARFLGRGQGFARHIAPPLPNRGGAVFPIAGRPAGPVGEVQALGELF